MKQAPFSKWILLHDPGNTAVSRLQGNLQYHPPPQRIYAIEYSNIYERETMRSVNIHRSIVLEEQCLNQVAFSTEKLRDQWKFVGIPLEEQRHKVALWIMKRNYKICQHP